MSCLITDSNIFISLIANLGNWLIVALPNTFGVFFQVIFCAWLILYMLELLSFKRLVCLRISSLSQKLLYKCILLKSL